MTTSAGKSRKTSWIPLCCVGIGAVKICLMSKATRSGGGRGLRSGNLGEYCVQVSQIVVVFRWKRPEYRADAFNAVAHHAGSLEHHLVVLLDQNTPDRQHRVQVTREGGAGNENFHVISPLGTVRRRRSRMAARTATRSPPCYRVISSAREGVTVVTPRGSRRRIHHCPRGALTGTRANATELTD